MTSAVMLRVSADTRDAVQRLGDDEFGGASADEVVRHLLDEHRRARMIALAQEYFADPANVAEYRGEAAGFDGAEPPVADAWDRSEV